LIFGGYRFSAVKSASGITSIWLRVGSNSNGVPSTEEVFCVAQTSKISKSYEGEKFASQKSDCLLMIGYW